MLDDDDTYIQTTHDVVMISPFHLNLLQRYRMENLIPEQETIVDSIAMRDFIRGQKMIIDFHAEWTFATTDPHHLFPGLDNVGIQFESPGTTPGDTCGTMIALVNSAIAKTHARARWPFHISITRSWGICSAATPASRTMQLILSIYASGSRSRDTRAMDWRFGRIQSDWYAWKKSLASIRNAADRCSSGRLHFARVVLTGGLAGLVRSLVKRSLPRHVWLKVSLKSSKRVRLFRVGGRHGDSKAPCNV